MSYVDNSPPVKFIRISDVAVVIAVLMAIIFFHVFGPKIWALALELWSMIPWKEILDIGFDILHPN